MDVSSKIIVHRLPDVISELSSIRNDILHFQRITENFQSDIQKIQFEHHYGGKMYIRFGKYHKSERSKIKLDNEWIQELGGKTREDGVSVYNTSPHQGKWILREPNNEKAVYNAKFDISFLADRIAAGEIYLVTGEELNSTGVDGEPLLSNVFPIKKLSPSEVELSSGIILEDYISKYFKHNSYLKPFSISNAEKRKIAIYSTFIEENLDKITDALKLTNDQAEELEQLVIKVTDGNLSQTIDALTESELQTLKYYIEAYIKYRNKSQVMKGFRPFY